MAAQTPVPGCLRHPGMSFIYSCVDCDEELVCARCVVDTHKGHTFDILEDFILHKADDIEKYIDEMNIENSSLEEKIANTEENIKDNEQTFSKMIADIKCQAQKMKDEIDIYANKLILLCSELEKSNADMLKAYKDALENLKDKNKSEMNDCQQILKSGTNKEKIEKAKQTKTSSRSSISPNPEKMKNVQFHPGPELVSQFEHLLGFVSVDDLDQQYQPVSKPKVIAEFTHDSYATICRPTRDMQAWTLKMRENNLYKVDQRGHLIETVHSKDSVYSICISPTTGRVWFCCLNDKSIREVMDSNSIVIRFVTENTPLSLCITEKNTVIVGTTDMIAMYTTDGLMVESDARGICKQGAIFPHYMAYYTQTGDVAVSDSENVDFHDYKAGKLPNKHPHVKVLNKHLHLKFRYQGQDKPRKATIEHENQTDTVQSLFFPGDICYDPTGNIIVVDSISHSIILIDGVRGDYIRTVYAELNAPQSICLQRDETLLVFFANRKVKIIK